MTAGGGIARIELRFAARRHSLDAVRRGVLEFLAPHRPSERAIYAVELIVEEVLTNVVRYGYPAGGEHEIELAVAIDGSEIELRFADDGAAFDPTLAPEPPPPASLADARVGGLGIKLLRRFASGLAYERNDGRNCLTVRLKRE